MTDNKLKITLENGKEYYIALSIDIKSKNYGLLMNTNNNSDICIVEIFSDDVRLVTEKDELLLVIEKMSKFVTTFYDI